MPKKISYEDNPWPDVKDFTLGDFEIVEDFPSPKELRNAKVSIIGDPALLISLSKKDMRSLERRAKSEGVSPHALAAAVLHAFVDHVS